MEFKDRLHVVLFSRKRSFSLLASPSLPPLPSPSPSIPHPTLPLPQEKLVYGKTVIMGFLFFFSNYKK